MITRAIGIAMVVVGVGLAYWGYQISESMTSQLTSQITGAMPEAVMYRYIGGAACGLAGLFLVLKGG